MPQSPLGVKPEVPECVSKADLRLQVCLPECVHRWNPACRGLRPVTSPRQCDMGVLNSGSEAAACVQTCVPAHPTEDHPRVEFIPTPCVGHRREGFSTTRA